MLTWFHQSKVIVGSNVHCQSRCIALKQCTSYVGIKFNNISVSPTGGVLTERWSMFQEKTGGQDVRDAMAGSRLVRWTARYAEDASRPLARERAQSPLHRSGRARDWDRGSRRVHHVITRLLDCVSHTSTDGVEVNSVT